MNQTDPLIFMNVSTNSKHKIIDEYMEDDIVYVLIKFTQDNLYAILSTFLAFLIAYWLGNAMGRERAAFVEALRRKFSDIEVQKKKFHNKITRIRKFQTWLKKALYFFIILEILLLIYLFYHYGLSYETILWNTVTRNGCIGAFALALICSLSRHFNEKRLSRLYKALSEVSQNVDEIGKELETGLGDQLITILKKRFLAPKETKTQSTQANHVQENVRERRLSADLKE
jgi:hypothetical protein